MNNPYKKLFLILIINLIVMFALTYVAVFSFSDIFLNVNRFYMAFLMVLSMPILMIVLMSDMYKNRKFNTLVLTISVFLFLMTFSFIRAQTLVGDKQFLRSMIPHHSGAITMCERSSVEDQEIKDLCEQIVETQIDEINQMKEILTRLENN